MIFPVYNDNGQGIQSPYVSALNHYASDPGPRTLEEDVRLHLIGGYVVGTPWLLALARPVDRRGDPGDIVDPGRSYDTFDCWHIYLAVGRLEDLVALLPYELPYISFERRGRLIIHETGRFMKLCQRLLRPTV